MSLNLGELVIGLRLDDDLLGPGLAKAKRELQGLSPVAETEVRRITREFDGEGKKAGGALAQGVRQGFIRNSPLIAAAVGAGLAAGAPVALAGAGVLFGGIGILAAAQSEEVQNAWNQVGRSIRDGAIADAQVLTPTLVGSADDIGAAFQRLRPQLRDVFADAGPQIEQTVDGVVELAENAMPGLTRAIDRAGPVVDGLNSFLASTGTGISDFFDAISDDAPEAGQALAAIGDILGALLPTAGELLGTGARIASVVLPPLADGLESVADGLEAVGPALPAVVTGLVALKAAQSAAGFLDRFTTSGDGAKRSMSLMGTASVVLGVAVAGAAAQLQAAQDQVDQYAQAILDGGAATLEAAEQARQASQGGFRELIDSLQFGDQTSPFEAMFGGDEDQMFEQATARARELYDAMSPLDQAQQDVTRATNDLELAVGRYGQTSPQATAASGQLASAQARLTREQQAVDSATRDLNASLAVLTASTITAASADLGMSNARLRVQSATESYNEVLADGKSTAIDRQQAENDLVAAYIAVSDAAADQVTAQAALAGQTATAEEVARAQIAAMQQMADDMGGAVPAAAQTLIGSLSATAATADAVTVAANGVTGAIVAIPGTKDARVNALTADARAALESLGIKVTTFPDGSTTLSADTGPAQTNLDNFIAAANRRSATVTVFQNIVTSTTQSQGSYRGEAPSGGNLPGLPPPPRARGGPVWPGTFLVGEEGPELVRMTGNGTVIPADATSRILSDVRAAAAGVPSMGATSAAGAAPAAVRSAPTLPATIRAELPEGMVFIADVDFGGGLTGNMRAVAQKAITEYDEHGQRDSQFLNGF